MPKKGLVKYFHMSVENFNSQLVEEFERGNDPLEVSDSDIKTVNYVNCDYMLFHSYECRLQGGLK